MKNTLFLIFLLSVYFLATAHSQVINPLLLIDQSHIQISSNDPLALQSAKIRLIPQEKILNMHIDSIHLATSPLVPLDRKKLSIAIPIVVPINKRLVIIAHEEHGSTIQRKMGAQAKISSEAFFTGNRGAVISRTISTAGKKNFILSSTSAVASLCGISTILRLNKSLVSKSSQIAGVKTSLKLVLQDCVK